MPRPEIVSNNIRRRREARGITQVEFAKGIGRSQSVVAQYETGKRMPSTETIGRIADYFGVSYDVVCTKDDVVDSEEDENWYVDYFITGAESSQAQKMSLTPEEIYFLKCFRDAEPTAKIYALQILEGNPMQKGKNRA